MMGEMMCKRHAAFAPRCEECCRCREEFDRQANVAANEEHVPYARYRKVIDELTVFNKSTGGGKRVIRTTRGLS